MAEQEKKEQELPLNDEKEFFDLILEMREAMQKEGIQEKKLDWNAIAEYAQKKMKEQKEVPPSV
ncbi:MAG: hypothetical protein UR46_C0013G0001 [Parcubacteria group bacterium GW2011_GWA1_33_6]|uniref:Uncharacterized protein n=1 Tax=Candidatus Staskawiczbacteria bacterium RIFCSPHIGHO2_02_FULL_33_16 TaxID=1802204 RepID=A0A1G2HWF0_9BACT|nr:MAG: hypothetical protein UR46_C0013G0001 [Parcubacteria group bacterium GW2011_GWA1_33_6]OGZ66793.1 MAG: hypothetical protein A3D34_03755 [Candidatus Staskawiczbacteria bacterium RIFCSPHIGHO2_02_FULL_33_16]OGZ70901.1 MAG: hypothetical protein A2980_02670 [Candidatus Staskawiczbacteria bacterium RIFCSPLOWO2_01_FULL_33_13]